MDTTDDDEVAARVVEKAAEMRAELEQRGALDIETLLIQAAFWNVHYEHIRESSLEMVASVREELRALTKDNKRDSEEFRLDLEARTDALRDKVESDYNRLVPLANERIAIKEARIANQKSTVEKKRAKYDQIYADYDARILAGKRRGAVKATAAKFNLSSTQIRNILKERE